MTMIPGLIAYVLVLVSANLSAAFDYQTKITGKDAVQIYESMTLSEGAFLTHDGEKTRVFVHYERVGDAAVRIRTELRCSRELRRCVQSGYTVVVLPHEDD